MARYTQDSIERVKQAVDIVELVSARTDLRRVGTRHVGLCPFHDERTPSFSVNADLNLFHCFGCQESGDAIGFVQKTEGLDFRESIELLADRYGIELKKDREDPEEAERRRRRERLLELLERATDYYVRYLWDSSEAGGARSYLATRGLGEEVLKAFRIGYAPSAWDRVLLAARRDGYLEEEIAGAGIGQRGRAGKLYDRFRARIMFPLADARGRVLGFGARALEDGGGPKYLNTSENSVYHKGRQLFGIHQARAAAAKAGRIVAVEGYTDVLALHQAGIAESVAIMGTSLTEEQMAELSRAAGTVFLALDADRAGQEAMLRAARMASSRDVELRVVALPDGRDPAEIVGEDSGRFEQLLRGSLSVPEFEVRRALATADLDSPRGRDRALAAVRPLVAGTPAGTALHDELVRYAADQLAVPPHYVLGAEPARRAAVAVEPAANPAAAPQVDSLLRAEREFLAMCVAQPEPAGAYIARLEHDHLSTGALRRLRDHLAAHLAEPLADLPADDPELVALAGEIAMLADEAPTSAGALRLGFLQLDLRRIDRALRAARSSKDLRLQRELWGQREQARAEMEAVMGEAL